MAVKAVVFDVGETLVDETGMWERAADAAGVPRFTLMGILGGLAARREHHTKVWSILGVALPDATWAPADFYPDALPCLRRLRSQGLLVALRAGMVAVHIRRGPWGHLHEPPPEAIRIQSLAELPDALEQI